MLFQTLNHKEIVTNGIKTLRPWAQIQIAAQLTNVVHIIRFYVNAHFKTFKSSIAPLKSQVVTLPAAYETLATNTYLFLRYML